jgi:hypothetical protein
MTTTDVISPDLKTVLRRLKLSRMLDTLPERLTLARQQKMPHQDLLLQVLSDEVARRDSLAITLRVQKARLDPTMRLEAYRVSRRPHFLGGWGLWDVRVGFRRRCGSARSGWWKSIARPTPRNGRCCSPSRRSWGAGGNAPEVGAAGAA